MLIGLIFLFIESLISLAKGELVTSLPFGVNVVYIGAWQDYINYEMSTNKKVYFESGHIDDISKMHFSLLSRYTITLNNSKKIRVFRGTPLDKQINNIFIHPMIKDYGTFQPDQGVDGPNDEG